MKEAYILVHQCGFTYNDVKDMPFLERNAFIELRVEESQRESAEIENAQSK
tara:strand:+ start:926 stop:1078 length:153 start_codon:yes stop_codon:yes gene_type:complete